MPDRKQVTISDIAYSLPAVKREIGAFRETLTEHDRFRALKAIDGLVTLIMSLRLDIETADSKPDVIDE